MKKVKLLFQGDSITDAGRDRENIHDLGRGYPSYAAEFLKAQNPDVEFEFIDLGISGNQTKDVIKLILARNVSIVKHLERRASL